MSGSSSHIFEFWCLIDSYPKTKYQASSLLISKKSESCLIFFEVTLQDPQDFGLLVAIYQKPKDENMR
jgi:hypothetical protein